MEYEVSYKKTRYLKLKVKDGRVLVTAPYLLPHHKIDEFVSSHEDYINKELSKYNLNSNKYKLYVGMDIIIMGESYKILKGTRNKIVDNIIYICNENNIKKILYKLFKDKLYDILSYKTNYYISLMNINKDIKVLVKNFKGAFGKYYRNRDEICYSTMMIFKNPLTYDYLVIHEVSHILYFNHSKEFYDNVAIYLPNYKIYRKMLKERDYNDYN